MLQRITSSTPPDAIVRPVGSQAALYNGLLARIGIPSGRCPDRVMLHSLSVLSPLTDASVPPAGLNAMSSTASVCPCRSPTAPERLAPCSVATRFRAASGCGFSEYAASSSSSDTSGRLENWA